MKFTAPMVLGSLVFAAALSGSGNDALAVCDKRNSRPECGIWNTALENPYVILAGKHAFIGTAIYRVCLVGKHPPVELDLESGGKVITTLKLPRNGAACRDVSINGSTDLQVRSRPEGRGVRGTYVYIR